MRSLSHLEDTTPTGQGLPHRLILQRLAVLQEQLKVTVDFRSVLLQVDALHHVRNPELTDCSFVM